MKIKLFLIAIIAITFSKYAVSQTVEDCLKDFETLVSLIKDDYPGYHDKITDENRSQLNALEREIRQKISDYPDSCLKYLNEYTGFFKDFHLRVVPKWKPNNEQKEIMEVSTYGKNIYVNVDSLHQKTKNSTGIEGVWEGFQQKFIVSKEGQKFVGIVVNNQEWKIGQVLYEFEPVNDTVFDVINYSLVKDRNTYKTKASLHLNGQIIEFHDDTRFVRKSDSDILDKTILYSYIPLYPNGRHTYPVAIYLSDSTFYLRIPSFSSNLANDFVIKHFSDITTRPNLIIDIRYNGGGQDNYYSEIAKLIYSKPFERLGVEWYATKGSIERKVSALEKREVRGGEEGIKWTQALVDEMKKNVGGFVTHPYNKNNKTMFEESTVLTKPLNVGIIINERNGSTAEQFLLEAKQSDKVILFGNCNTAGVLDYSNAVYINLPSNNFSLLCPETRSKRLPENPLDNIGIYPDIIIPFPATEQLFGRLDDWVYFVKNYLEFLDKEK